MSWWSSFKNDSSFIREYLWKYRNLVFWGLLSLVIVDALEIVPPLLLKRVVDVLTSDLGDIPKQLIQIGGVYIGISVIQAIGRFGWRFFLIRTSMVSGRDLRERYTHHLFSLSNHFYDKRKIGELMSLATSDIEAIRMAMGGGLIIFADAVVYLLTVPVAMFILSPELTFLSFIPLMAVPFIVLRCERLINIRFTKVQEAFSKLAAHAQENLMGIRVVKGFSRENAQIQQFKKAGEEYLRLNLELSRVQSSFGPTLDFVMSLGLVILLYFGGARVLDNTLTLGTFIAFQRYIQKMVWPMTAVGLSVSFYQRAVAGSNRLKDVLSQKTETPAPADPKLPEVRIKTPQGKWRSQGQVEFRHLTYHYPESSNLVLKDLSFTIQPGERVAFVGQIGSGKTTLVNLIPRLYSPPKGTVFVDGIDVNDWSLADLRDQIGYVSQDTFLFSETIFNNVAMGLFKWATQQERQPLVLSATERAAVHNDITRMDRSYQTELGERGVNVSGGQKQRLTIARAVATEPPILILDDALSSVDMHTEEMILSGLRDRAKRNTEIICAHRISTVKEANRIIVLSNGQILQEGSHEQLLSQKGSLYWRFYEQQRLQEEVDNYVPNLQT
jgi:ATP-binding cassette subfamily B protein